jgi:myo-inositol 2-dehydrogenase/D-chiro-inositol 1-dehydrogenase
MNEVGLAVVGCGTIGRIRAELARDYPGVKWLGLCDIRKDAVEKLADDCNADFYTTDLKLLLLLLQRMKMLMLSQLYVQ